MLESSNTPTGVRGSPLCHAGLVRMLTVLLLASASVCNADPRVQKMLERLAEDAAAFELRAPSLISVETLKQRAEKVAKRGLLPRVDYGSRTGELEFQTREIVSEYAFSVVGDPPSIREVRKVLSVDGNSLTRKDPTLGELLRSVQAGDSRSRKKLLEDFEKHGLIGTVTDFGQILLLFDRQHQEHYEFSLAGERLSGAERCLVFNYVQRDGPGVITIWEPRRQMQSPAAGEIWVTRDGYRVIRITMKTVRGEGSAAVRDEAQVDYICSTQMPPVPVSVIHREYHQGRLTAENLFNYTPFKELGSVPRHP